MFKTIGRIADRYRYPLLLGWIVAAVLITLLAPKLDDVTSNDQSNFLPDDASSVVARELVHTYFPDQVRDGSVVLVFDAGPNAQITDPVNWAYMQKVSQWLTGPEAPAHIQSVQSPTLNPAAASALIAKDGQVGMVVVTLNTTDMVQQSDLLDAIGTRLEDAPAGLSTYRTGESAIGHTYNDTITKSVDRTVFVTLVLVVVILLAIYRSPVSPLIPLSVVTVAFIDRARDRRLVGGSMCSPCPIRR